MKCFVHQSADAVGLCRNCSRGVCAECAADRASGIACMNRCEAAVDAMDSLVRRNVAVASKPGVTQWTQVVVYLGAALVFSFLAYSDATNGGRNNVAVLFAILAAIIAMPGLLLLRWIFANAAPSAKS